MKQLKRTLALALFTFIATTLVAEEPGKDEAKEFQAVVKQLDMNGNFLLFMNANQIQEKLAKGFTDAQVKLAPQTGRGFRKMALVSNMMKVMYDGLGFSELTSFGMSSVATGDDSYRNKIVMQTKNDPKGLLWNIFGGKPQPLKSLELLPRNTCFATASTMDIAFILKWLEAQGRGSTPVSSTLRRMVAELNKKADMNTFLKGFGGELALVMTLSQDKPMTLPLRRDDQMILPGMAVSILAKVNDDNLKKFVIDRLAVVQMEGQLIKIHGVEVHKFKIPRYSGPIDLTPMVASHAGYLFLSTNVDAMTDLLAVATAKEKGFATTALFKKMSTGIKPEGNSYHLMTPEFGKLVTTLVSAFPKTMSRHDPDRAVMEVLATAGKGVAAHWSYGMTTRQSTGYSAQVNSSDGSGAGLVLQLAGAPVAVGIAALLPAVGKARVKAQRANSAGNLKQMGLAMLGYSGDYGGDFPKKDGADGLNRIIETNDLPWCKVYVNPRDKERMLKFDPHAKKMTEEMTSYAYVGGGLRDDNTDSTQMPLIWEKPHGDDWVNVLFIDGHVGGTSGHFKTNVDIVKTLKERSMIADGRVDYYMKKALRMDNGLGIKPDDLPKETVKALDGLIAKLGAEDFKVRKQAQADLKKHMPKAYQYLAMKLKDAKDPEIKSRLKKIIESE